MSRAELVSQTNLLSSRERIALSVHVPLSNPRIEISDLKKSQLESGIVGPTPSEIRSIRESSWLPKGRASRLAIAGTGAFGLGAIAFSAATAATECDATPSGTVTITSADMSRGASHATEAAQDRVESDNGLIHASLFDRSSVDGLGNGPVVGEVYAWEGTRVCPAPGEGGGSTPTTTPAQSEATAPAHTQTLGDTYTVQAGDFYSKIAAKDGPGGVTIDSILTANGWNPSHVIHPGDIIKTGKSSGEVIHDSTPPAPTTSQTAPFQFEYRRGDADGKAEFGEISTGYIDGKGNDPDNIGNLQYYLNQAGYPVGSDDKFGPQTLQQYAKFIKDNYDTIVHKRGSSNSSVFDLGNPTGQLLTLRAQQRQDSLPEDPNAKDNNPLPDMSTWPDQIDECVTERLIQCAGSAVGEVIIDSAPPFGRFLQSIWRGIH